MKLKPHVLTTIFCIAILILVFAFYYQTIFFGIKAFDEITPFKETHLPVCLSFSEIFELISLLGLNQHFEASNTLYSSIISIRSNPIGDFLVLITQFFCKKNPIHYHLYSLTLHLINTFIFFAISNKISFLFFNNSQHKMRLLVISLLAFLWATHPANIESVLLLTNYNAILSYTLSLITIFIYINLFSFDFNHKRLSLLKQIFMTVPYLIALFIAEYLFMLPFILFFYTLGMQVHFKKERLAKAAKASVELTLPLFIVTVFFILSFLLSSNKINFESQSSPGLILERIFWFSPQILFHLISLTLLPIKLSIDQTFFVKIARSLFDPYAVFCFGFIVFALVIAFISLIRAKKNFPAFYIIFLPFFLTLIPFSHILAPVYNLASERYLYLPSFILIFGIAHILFLIISKLRRKLYVYLTIVLLSLIVIVSSCRAYKRSLDWTDSFSLYFSTVETANNPLYKAFRYKLLAPQEKVFTQFQHREVSAEYQQQAIKHLKTAINNLEVEKKKYQSSIPRIVKNYGLDPATLQAKAGYLLSHSNYTINNKPEMALNIIKPFIKDLSLLDNAALSFYASLLFFDKKLDKAEEILRYAYKRYPYSIRIIFPLCQLIYMRSDNLSEVEQISTNAFKYYSYDTFTLLFLTKLYKLKGDFEKHAFYSYAYGLRHHSIEYLENAKMIYQSLNKQALANKISKRIEAIKAKLKK